jgi:TatD DNase family protein
MKGWIDTHAHLDYPDFAQDLPAILQRAHDAGVEKIITIGTDPASNLRAIQLAETYPNLYASLGIHPGNVEHETEESLSLLESLLTHPKVVAVGECGTDYHHLPPQEENASESAHLIRLDQLKAKQAKFFRAQLDLAVKHGLNVVIHQRNSWVDTLHILQNYTGKLHAVFHCFGESPERAAEILAWGHLVSFTGILTFKNAQLVRTCAATLPAGTYMIETDCPYLAPIPHRGKRCEPCHVVHVAEALAQERKLSTEDLQEELALTTNRFFRFP